MIIKLITDFLPSDMLVCGGAEYNDNIIYELLKKQNVEIEIVRSNDVSLNFLNSLKKETKLIISNFIFLKEESKKFISENFQYIIWEHDHKYLINRNPASYLNFTAPRDEIINYDFYKNAKYIACQSNFHKQILEKNLNLKNTINLSGNFWSEGDLEYINYLFKNSKKREICSILQSNNDNKNTAGSIKYCKEKDIKYELIFDSNYKIFLQKISNNSKFLFLPKTPETLSRVCVEAKILGCGVLTNNLVGCKHEDWFKKDSESILEYLNDFRISKINLILQIFSE